MRTLIALRKPIFLNVDEQSRLMQLQEISGTFTDVCTPIRPAFHEKKTIPPVFIVVFFSFHMLLKTVKIMPCLSKQMVKT